MSVLCLLFADPAAGGISGSIASRGGTIFRPVVSGDWVAWSELGNLGLYAYNLATGEERTVVTPVFDPRTRLVHGSVMLWPYSPWHPQIAIDGTTVVWADRRVGEPFRDSEIYAYDLAAGVETRIGPVTGSFGSAHYYPSLDDGRIAWQGGGWRVMTSGADGSDVRMLGAAGGPVPDVAGDLVVWTSGAAGASLYAADLTTGAVQRLHTFTAQQNPRGPVTDGRTIAWSMRDLTSGQNIVSIMAYDLATGELITILEHTGSPEHRSNVAISDGVVIWEDWRHNTDDVNRLDLDVWGHDLATGKSFPIATGPGNQHEPWIDGDRVVWVGELNRERTIGYATLAPVSAPEPTSAAWYLTMAGVAMMRRPCHKV